MTAGQLRADGAAGLTRGGGGAAARTLVCGSGWLLACPHEPDEGRREGSLVKSAAALATAATSAPPSLIPLAPADRHGGQPGGSVSGSAAAPAASAARAALWGRLDTAELYVGEQVQRVGHQLLRRETKTEASEAPLPLPDLCVTALKLRRQQQDADRERTGDAWIDTGLVFTTRHGTPIEPRNFSRSFDRRITRAKVPRITVHGARKTCGSLLATLDVHPRVAMQILRHSKIAVTMEIYTEVPSASTRAALKKLGRWLGT
jgi:hypothetical protein